MRSYIPLVCFFALLRVQAVARVIAPATIRNRGILYELKLMEAVNRPSDVVASAPHKLSERVFSVGLRLVLRIPSRVRRKQYSTKRRRRQADSVKID